MSANHIIHTVRNIWNIATYCNYNIYYVVVSEKYKYNILCGWLADATKGEANPAKMHTAM